MMYLIGVLFLWNAFLQFTVMRLNGAIWATGVLINTHLDAHETDKDVRMHILAPVQTIPGMP